jgi:transposase
MPPMWTNENRLRYDRSKLRYPSDLTDEEWALIAPVIPPAKRGGGKRTVSIREVVNGLMYVLSSGCQWRAIPKDLPPRSTVNGYFALWDYDGTLDRIHHALYVKCREQAEREASPTAAIIDSQSVKSAEKGGRASIRTASTRVRKSKARSAVCHEHIARVRRCGAVQEMRVGPSRSAVRCRPQTAASCSRQERLW